MPGDEEQQKRALRAELRERRQLLSDSQRESASDGVAAQLHELIRALGARSVSCFLSTTTEPGTRRVVREAYADRAYQPNGLLVPRGEAGAVLHDAEAIANRAVRLARDGELVAVDGRVLHTGARSLCLHGDNAEAVAIAQGLKARLDAEGIAIAATL